jgi:hypothetical protein
MSNNIFTAVYSKNGFFVADISVRKDSEKIHKVNKFIESSVDDIRLENEGSILTIIRLFDQDTPDQADLFIQSFFDFID